MSMSRIDKVRSFDLKALIDELQGLYYLSSSKPGPESLHNFVRGLILAEKILQVINGNLRRYKYRANWGQIVDKTGKYLSKECDIIIYRGSPLKEWGTKAIKFVVVEESDAKLVIQCCTDCTSLSSEHKEYTKNLKRFVPEVWYLSERYWGTKNQYNVIKKRLKNYGYDKFFALYRIYERQSERLMEPNDKSWNEFINSIRSLR